MRYLCVVLLAASLGASLAALESRVRPLDPWAAESIGRLVERSALARGLAKRIESSDLIVFIETRAVMPADLAGTTQFITSAGGYRYVRVALRRTLEPTERAAILGHELQHACELADSDAADLPAVRRLYEGLGQPVRGQQNMFDTGAAVRAGQQVWRELRSRQAEPSHLASRASRGLAP